jgi:hypothetical protein
MLRLVGVELVVVEELEDSDLWPANKGLKMNIANRRPPMISSGLSRPFFFGGSGGNTGTCTPANCPGVSGGADGPQALPSQ